MYNEPYSKFYKKNQDGIACQRPYELNFLLKEELLEHQWATLNNYVVVWVPSSEGRFFRSDGYNLLEEEVRLVRATSPDDALSKLESQGLFPLGLDETPPAYKLASVRIQDSGLSGVRRESPPKTLDGHQ